MYTVHQMISCYMLREIIYLLNIDLEDHCNPDPCLNGATCKNEAGWWDNEYMCHCAAGYFGTRCENGGW